MDKEVIISGSYRLLYVPSTGELLDIAPVIASLKPSEAPQDIIYTKGRLPYCHSLKELKGLFKGYGRYRVYGPVMFNNSITRKDYDKLMSLCKLVVGRSYLFTDYTELSNIWGISEKHASRKLHQFESYNLLRIIHKKCGVLVEVNPVYVWKDKDTTYREDAIRCYYKLPPYAFLNKPNYLE